VRIGFWRRMRAREDEEEEEGNGMLEGRWWSWWRRLRLR
jgi:hypothetical protein